MSVEVNHERRRLLATAIVCAAAAQFGMARRLKAQTASQFRLPIEDGLPSFEGATEWLNSQPLTARSLRGNVVLVNFWTFSCINSIRVLPYLRAWANKYKDRGLVVIGVQAPEFEFEKNVANVRWAVKDRVIDYPIAIDNNLAIWRAFNNEYWPALYFIDASGRIRHHQFGEGKYDRSEAVIQLLLAEAGVRGFDEGTTPVEGRGIEATPDWPDLRSPETYLGYERTENFASAGAEAENKLHSYAIPPILKLNHWALKGAWTAKKQSVVLNEPMGRIAYRFHARDLHLIMGPAVPRTAVRFRVTIDGQEPRAAHGVDVDGHGNGTVIEQRLYQLIRQSSPIADHQFEIEFLDPGVEAFDFTFG